MLQDARPQAESCGPRSGQSSSTGHQSVEGAQRESVIELSVNCATPGTLFSRSRVKKPSHPPGRPIHEHKHFQWILWGSFILCFNAGYINSITLNTYHEAPVAHVTGMVARASIALASQNWHLFTMCSISYVSFFVGACVSGMTVSYESFYLGRAYGRALFMVAVTQSVALIIEDSFDDSVYLVYCCALACGLQNGLTSKYSGNAVRTTHLTGTTTDLGIAVGHIIKGRANEWWKVRMHVTSITGFFLGGMAGWYAFETYEHAALLTSIVLTSFCGFAHTIWLAYHEQISVIKVLESTEDFRIHTHRPPPDRSDRSDPLQLSGSSIMSAASKIFSHHTSPAVRASTPQIRSASPVVRQQQRAGSPFALPLGLSPRSILSISKEGNLERGWSRFEEYHEVDIYSGSGSDPSVELPPEEDEPEEEYEEGDLAREEEAAHEQDEAWRSRAFTIVAPETHTSSGLTW